MSMFQAKPPGSARRVSARARRTLPFGLVSGGPSQAELLHLVLEALARDRQPARGFGHVAAGLFERSRDQVLLEALRVLADDLLQRPDRGRRHARDLFTRLLLVFVPVAQRVGELDGRDQP